MPIVIVRAAVAVVMMIHGVHRATMGSVDSFGIFLAEVNGFPLGHALAWTITVVEIVGGALFAFGIAVVPLAAWFVAVLGSGIWLVHWGRGWFVVGSGTGGMEFSILLIACLVAVALAHWPGRSRAAEPTSTTGSSP